MKSRFSLLMLFPVTLFLFSCGNNNKAKQASEKLTGSITIDGSSTVYPITEAVAEEYKKVEPSVKVAIGISGTGGGFKKFTRGETDINDASRSIKKAEDSLASANNISYLELLIAYDGMAVVVNPKNDWCKSMTVAELKMLWAPEAQGKIKKWNQIRKEWPDKEIHLFGAGVESGTYDYFTEAIVGKSHSSRGDYTASEDDNVLVQGIASDMYALGFFGLSYYEENKDKLSVIGIDDGKDDNGKGPILPSIETVKNKTYAPLGRPLFLYITNTAAKRNEVQSFVTFYLNHVNTLSKDVGYVPLSDDENKSVVTKWNEFLKEHSAAH
jgi:phosphate transport system substrate-binding protein